MYCIVLPGKHLAITNTLTISSEKHSSTGVANFGPGVPLSCRVLLQP